MNKLLRGVKGKAIFISINSVSIIIAILLIIIMQINKKSYYLVLFMQ